MDQGTTNKEVAGAAASRPPASTGRFSAAAAAWSLDRTLRAARKREKTLLAEAGVLLFAAQPDAVRNQAGAAPLLATITAVAAEISSLDAALKKSLDQDRADYAKASQLMRWVVVGRGFLDRWILGDRLRNHRRERARLDVELGALAFDGAHDPLLAHLSPAVKDGVSLARANIATAEAERVAILAPWGGKALPPWLDTAVGEIREFLVHFWDQLSRRLFLRVPAIGALVAGWWIANHYTDNTLERIQRSMGFGGRAHLSPHTLSLLKFWVPIATAAFCTYAVATIAKRVQRKYALPKENATPASP